MKEYPDRICITCDDEMGLEVPIIRVNKHPKIINGVEVFEVLVRMPDGQLSYALISGGE